jgi:hypothetical protein
VVVCDRWPLLGSADAAQALHQPDYLQCQHDDQPGAEQHKQQRPEHFVSESQPPHMLDKLPLGSLLALSKTLKLGSQLDHLLANRTGLD